jgi:hypothetical protein
MLNGIRFRSSNIQSNTWRINKSLELKINQSSFSIICRNERTFRFEDNFINLPGNRTHWSVIDKTKEDHIIRDNTNEFITIIRKRRG